ncbi:hypothetical protein OROGR_029888 [Orobanche gracilis]
MDKEMMIAAKTVFSLVFGGLLVFFLRIFDASIFKPRRLRSKLEKRGFKGPVPSLLYGNIPEMERIILLQKPLSAAQDEISHDWFASVFPHLERWRNEYGVCTSLNLDFVEHMGMVKMMAESTLTMLKAWENRTQNVLGKVEIIVDEDLRSLSTEIISRACFGEAIHKGIKYSGSFSHFKG